MPEIVFITLMVALLVFIVWDAMQPAKARSRDEMSRGGFIPGGKGSWVAFLTLALVCFILAFREFSNPSVPPFTGRASTVMGLAYLAFGQSGPAFLWIGVGVIFVIIAFNFYQFNRRS